MNMNLRTFFSSALAVVIILLTVLLSYVIGNESTKSLEMRTGSSLGEVAYQMSENLDQFIWSRSGEIEVLSKLNAFQEPVHKEEIDGVLDELKKSMPVFSWVGYLDTKGNVISSTDDVWLGENVSERPVFKEGIKGPFVGDVHDAEDLAKLMPSSSEEPLQFVDYSTPVYNDQGNKIGVLAAHFSWEWSRQVEKSLIAPLQERLKGVEVFIVSKKDNTILLGPPNVMGQSFDSQALNQARSGKNSWILDSNSNNSSYLTGYSYSDGYLNYPGLGWTVIIRQPADVAFASVDQLEKLIILAGMATAVLFGILGWLMAGWIVRSLNQVVGTVDLLSSGVDVEISTSSRFKDIAILSASLRNLVSNLTKTETALTYISDMARHDALTGLPNRLALDDFLAHAVSRAKQNYTTLSFLYLDLDGFKRVNDDLGHDFGDRLLQEVSFRLLDCTRDNEIVTRIGGDEFVVILHTSAKKAMQEAEVVAKRIINKINEPFHIDGERIIVGCNVGAAVWSPESQDTSETLRLADEALYISKRSGKNRITFETAV
ncbi:sensor domain-containing diguanylate cyclase [Paenibacillus wynnii]|uniref:sensor domain-containing diguanylate cyclase n=1 Tax=Paenibacillus wynnii TaxID=268407 RepID=UPI0027938BBD|nr:sensor domain-containing diguanylate cyclase [Paenibacillus wynnii]MDQ0195660.1 diguanylate cyclase (GGDEF)-like protein [Paenibacillus wynnii]